MAEADLLHRIAELERVSRFEADLRELTLAVTQSLSSTLNLQASFARLCCGGAPLFGARHSTAWMLDRRARELVLEASSDASTPKAPRLPMASAPPHYMNALRRSAPELVTWDGRKTLAVPLRGRRRALGLLLLEDLGETPVPASRLLEGAAVLGRQISTAIENTILFEDILQSRRELENTFNSLADLVVVCDRHGRVRSANRAFRDRVASHVAHPLDRQVSELVGPALAEWLSGAGQPGSLPVNGEVREFEDPLLDGRFSVRVTPLFGADRVAQGIVVVAQDQTEQLRLQAERAALSKRLAQSEKLAALGQFVAGVAHELNNPLQGVLGHLELLRATGRVPRALQPDLRVVYREADRAARIVNNLLVFAGSRRGAHRRVNLNAVVSRTAAVRARIAKRSGITISRDLDLALPNVRGDSMLLQQALLNILINAEHAIASVEPGTGDVRITTRAESRRTRVIVEVKDTGPGIPPDVLSRMFEPFFTTKEVGQGTGLGLAIAYGIVKDHKGEISAKNDRRGGAVFRIVLPADKMGASRPTRHD